MARSSGRIYEYACHEANYSLVNMLRGYRSPLIASLAAANA